MQHRFFILLSSIFALALIGACSSTDNQETSLQDSFVLCPDGMVETQNTGLGDSFVCCPVGMVAQDGLCQGGASPNLPVKNQEPVVEVKNESLPSEEKIASSEMQFVLLEAPFGRGKAYCPVRTNSLAWNGQEYKCCGYQMKSTLVHTRGDSICCLAGTESARWVGKSLRDYECCPLGTVATRNEGTGDKFVCCKKDQVAKNGQCQDPVKIDQMEAVEYKEGKVLLLAPNNKGRAYCPDEANSLAWDGTQYQCCGKGLKATLVPSRGDSICCPQTSTEARWVGQKWSDYKCCPEGTVEIKNIGEGDKYLCCKKGQKALDGECFSVE